MLGDLHHDVIINNSPEPQLSDYPPMGRIPLSLLHSLISFSSCKTPRGLWAGSIPKWAKVCPHKWSRERKGPAGPGQEARSPRLHGPHLERAGRSRETRQRRQSCGRTKVSSPLLALTLWPQHAGPGDPPGPSFVLCWLYFLPYRLTHPQPCWLAHGQHGVLDCGIHVHFFKCQEQGIP